MYVFQADAWLLVYHNMVITQVGHWTLDNTSNNGTFMEELECLLHKSNIDLDTWTDRSCASHTSLIFVASISLPNSLMLPLVTSMVWHSFPCLPTTSHLMTPLTPTQSHVVKISCAFYKALVSATKNSTKLLWTAMLRGGF
jgi:hypothetical protein